MLSIVRESAVDDVVESVVQHAGINRNGENLQRSKGIERRERISLPEVEFQHISCLNDT
jgi:hypothetical protein